MEARKEEFRQYLEDSGVISALTKVLIKLYEMKYDRPESAVAFIQKNLSDDFPSMVDYQNALNELNEHRAKLAEFKKATGADTSVSAEEKKATEGSTKVDQSKDPIENAKIILEKLRTDDTCKSLLKQHLTEELFERLKGLTTNSGKTLIDCINSGLENPKSSIGIYAADDDAYTVFKELFDKIIKAYHGFDENAQHPDPIDGWDGDDKEFADLTTANTQIVSARIRCARSLENYPLNPAMTEENYEKLLEEVTAALKKLTGEHEGETLPLDGMDQAKQQDMIDNHQLFKADDENLKAAGALGFWPKGRAIYANKANTFFVWINEEDHLRFISMSAGGDIQTIYNLLKDGVKACEADLKFKKDKRLGYITFCPTNLGSTIRASVMIKLPNLAAAKTLQKLADDNNLQIRGTHGNYT